MYLFCEVIFRHRYLFGANRPLLSHVAGFISIERFQSLATEGKMLSLSWWENEYAVLQWKNHVLHAKAQQEGRESIFDFYKISIAHITREYSFKKDKDNV
ncbi:antibiotic biosynthesis monooxygenase family protein [Escherichia coli]|uniref:antibiotic biosynthesis monooxygenase family protein n=1 Tax=Escherichia coli TaxID=562 RepID=UPI0009072CA7|nr:antibiotic biosynthesis monooxygenase [Escherichia coli]EFE8111539.1 antibiotic biosynthesis monooxygenase [Escherichia coli]EFE8111787.1 antibiotic biosynthesis monooxygenase [Escherichia coli]MBO9096404.1 antibiotic biosynthesis monooxygenase [Escherichia coli]HAH9765478.1 antibiotic biosynthesis monooxygenase [Escherichia coli]HAH9765641.1 antibiotic biosynthesis monooxygenase [Escherichia coli]